MSVRRRILLAALAVGVVGTVVVLIWTLEPKDSTPKLEFTLLGYTNSFLKEGVVRVTNCEQRPIGISALGAMFDNDKAPYVFALTDSLIVLKCGESWTNSLLIDPTNYGRDPRSRWAAFYYVERSTFSNRLRIKLRNLPVIGRHIKPPAKWQVTSDWFEQ